ncbi:methylated-DNA--[protein]-cysteine S-methyltransferase [Pelomonas sp. SE-A7]|uniref:methylated-DNA--[protein]-cysteine S-methyltransferase n=1 Tax=Pelomonas sp. SE-A7 TaxID=3054953 RepID=UPI00259CC82D|nr:methylated-DNA--[protein]-cysteine S-methyltransferase [Pelomonas sp. SE-A7]MDM4765420.1 methylated-DNA--[protein]-cysteine S-methyltransferase [Pelomonas sp. SE-A7]
MKPQVFFHCYETALGCCGIAWTLERGICGCQLPEESATATRDRMRVRFPAARESEQPPAFVSEAMAGVRALLSGEVHQLLEVQLDESEIADFNRQVHALTRQIPVGQTRTYGELALALGQPGAARAVGRAEGSNPFAPIVPCHRVMGADGAGTGFSAHGGIQTKLKLLRIEARATGQTAAEQGALFD